MCGKPSRANHCGMAVCRRVIASRKKRIPNPQSSLPAEESALTGYWGSGWVNNKFSVALFLSAFCLLNGCTAGSLILLLSLCRRTSMLTSTTSSSTWFRFFVVTTCHNTPPTIDSTVLKRLAHLQVGLGRSPQLSKFKSPVANKETAPTLPAKTENNVASAYTKASASAGKPQKQNQADRSRPRAPKTANKPQTANKPKSTNKIPTTDQTGSTKADAKIKKKNEADHAAFVAKIIANRRKLEKEAHARIVAKRKLKREILEKEKLREQIVEAAIEAAARNATKKKKNLKGEKAKAKPRKSKPVHAKNEITCKPKAENGVFVCLFVCLLVGWLVGWLVGLGWVG